MNIYVANLDFEINKDSLREIFLTYGDVSSAKIVVDQMTGKSRGIGFVNMPDPTAGRAAIQALDGKLIKGIRVTVNETLSKNQSAKRKFL